MCHALVGLSVPMAWIVHAFSLVIGHLGSITVNTLQFVLYNNFQLCVEEISLIINVSYVCRKTQCVRVNMGDKFVLLKTLSVSDVV